MKITYRRGYIYSLQYHIVWCVKYRRKIITSTVEKSLLSIINKIADDNNFKIPNVMKALKGVSARLLMKQYGDSLRHQLYAGHLWNPSYFIATVSENTEEQIKEYIHKQKEK